MLGSVDLSDGVSGVVLVPATLVCVCGLLRCRVHIRIMDGRLDRVADVLGDGVWLVDGVTSIGSVPRSI